MSYYAYLSFFIAKNGKLIENNEVPDSLKNEVIFIEDEWVRFEDCLLENQDFHPGNIYDQFKKLSQKYNDFIFILKEVSVTLETMSLDYIWDGKQISKTVELNVPIISTKDFS